MNEEFYEHAKQILEDLTAEELAEGLIEVGIDVTIRQYPEQEQP